MASFLRPYLYFLWNHALEPQLDWSAYDSYGTGDAYAQLPSGGGAYGKAAAVCIGNRQCQRTDKGVMCPSYRATLDDAHSTRFRAAALKAALNGELGTQPFAGPELAAAMDLCVSCKGCKRECPNGVDIAMLRSEYLAQRWQHTRMPLRERLFAKLPQLMLRAARFSWLFSVRERVPGVAWLAERWFGIAAQRSLPRWAPQSFLARATWRQPVAANGRREVVLLVDTFSNYLEPGTAAAACDVLEAAGYAVHIAAPAAETANKRPLCCGRTAFSSGQIGQARHEAQRMVEALWPYVERGLPVIGLEPSCLLMLRDEYHALGLGPRIKKIAESALLLEEFLAREHEAKRLRLTFKPLAMPHALVHGHCHQKAFGAMKSMRKVLGLVPQLQVDFVESSCCGMAGAFGFEAEHYEMSMKMGELALLPAMRAAGHDTLLIANGTSCRHQIRDGAQREAMHFVHLLHAALA